MFQQSQPQKFGTLLGSTTAPTGGLFGASTQQPQQPAPSGSLFGGSTQQPAATGSLFGGSIQQPQRQTGNLFGGTLGGTAAGGAAAPAGSLFGGSQLGASQQQQQQQQPQQSLFGGLLPQPQPQAQQSQQSGLPPLRASALGVSLDKPAGPREKPTLEQVALLYKKWNANDAACAFEGYTYNQVGPDAIKYEPGPDEDPVKWDEALAKRPNVECVPFLLRGFQAIHTRIQLQDNAVNLLTKKLHEINDHLKFLMQNHDLKTQVRCNEARNRHNAFTQRVVKLAAKVQILRNRGYAMDSTEEELKKKLHELEKKAFDPILGGRQEEIWARMSAARARAQILQAESEKLGQATQTQDGSVLNEADQKQLRQLLEGYDSQLTHLKKEIDGIRKDYEEWEIAQKPAPTK
ncbi:uncharacterized protein BDZ99DRAFT_487408 [Mytilinidion resinicola]|uniref:Nucleoporin Nup54 alpha-helical domain-containing protein n=1 Tax=Mytilinidion resinicola TaxID=574789 RepID=A0A6A6YTJ8_9PEZI|nr:uncharacterized protein BDZ99DRAFT_487408 [Mytilinidion resinicola]KAF2811849.1 hypothetical protein BDZ99DRAFT_487408 [Mytilinidion resinicola]